MSQGGAGSPRDGSVRWLVRAPKSDRVVLIEGAARIIHTMSRRGTGFFRFLKDHVPNGQRYLYRLHDGPERPEPASG